MALVTQKQTWQIHAVCVCLAPSSNWLSVGRCLCGHTNVPGAVGGLDVFTASETGTLRYVLVTADGHHPLGTIECREGHSGMDWRGPGGAAEVVKHKAGARERGGGWF